MVATSESASPLEHSRCETLSSRLEPIVNLTDKSVRAWELLARPLPHNLDLWTSFYSELPEVIRGIRDQGLIAPTSPISINVDTWQLGNDSIMDSIASMSSDNIAIEWTEHVPDWVNTRDLLTNAGSFLQEVSMETGIPVWVDDAGAGLDALRRISEARPAAVKISGEMFLRAMDDAYTHDVLALLLEMAGRVGSLTVIEHIESVAQADLALRLGADCGQGFLWAGRDVSHDEAIVS